MDKIDLQSLKNRYDIIGNDAALNRALEIAVSVAPTDLAVLIIGESGVGKETFPKLIHQCSLRKGGKYFAVNCGAIPEGTIDSELFGHEKGSFTGANEMRRGYFEEADGGTLFLDEIGELPLSSQAKLLRVLQDGEFIRVGSSKVLKTDVRVIAATNVDLSTAVSKGKFRQDLYYRLNSIMVKLPSLRERPDDIPLLFRKFASDFSEKYRVSKINLSPDAVTLLKSYRWPGNIRQLKNVAESVSALESSGLKAGSGRCEISASVLERYMPQDGPCLPSVAVHEEGLNGGEREMLFRMVYQLRQEVSYLKERVDSLSSVGPSGLKAIGPQAGVPSREESEEPEWQDGDAGQGPVFQGEIRDDAMPVRQAYQSPVSIQTSSEPENLSIQNAGLELLKKALEKHNGNRKAAAAELGYSERTLYRKLEKLGLK